MFIGCCRRRSALRWRPCRRRRLSPVPASGTWTVASRRFAGRLDPGDGRRRRRRGFVDRGRHDRSRSGSALGHHDLIWSTLAWWTPRNRRSDWFDPSRTTWTWNNPTNNLPARYITINLPSRPVDKTVVVCQSVHKASSLILAHSLRRVKSTKPVMHNVITDIRTWMTRVAV